jgi:hypothetical protein
MSRADQTCIKTIQRKVNLLQICLSDVAKNKNLFIVSHELAECGRKIVKLDKGQGECEGRKRHQTEYFMLFACYCDLPSSGTEHRYSKTVRMNKGREGGTQGQKERETDF